MAKKQDDLGNNDNGNDKIVKITKKGLSIFRKESELNQYITDGWIIE